MNKLYCPEINNMVLLTGSRIGKHEVAKIFGSDKYCIVKTQQIFAIDSIIARYVDDFIGDADVYTTK